MISVLLKDILGLQTMLRLQSTDVALPHQEEISSLVAKVCITDSRCQTSLLLVQMANSQE